MNEKKKRKTAAVVIAIKYHEALQMFFKKKGVAKKYQVEFALMEYFKKEAPEIYDFLVKKNP